MPLKEGDPTEVFEGVTVTDNRDHIKREKSVICMFPANCHLEWLRGLEKPIPRTQVPEGFEFPGDDNTDQAEPFEVEISAWIIQQWEDEPPVTIPNVEVIREVDGDYGPALKVRIGGETKFANLKGLHHKNKLREPGMVGDLLVFEWLGKILGVAGDGKVAGRKQYVPKGGTKPAANVGQDARASAPPAEDDEDGEAPPF